LWFTGIELNITSMVRLTMIVGISSEASIFYLSQFHESSREQGAHAETTVPPHEIEDIERRASLYRFVDRLPAEQRRVLVMRFAEERSIREIASAIGRSEGAVKQLQWRGLQTLRARMGTNHG
jgi:RNA polymerase sigma factor (sigma-70 family)